jgi:hypothetical protein
MNKLQLSSLAMALCLLHTRRWWMAQRFPPLLNCGLQGVQRSSGVVGHVRAALDRHLRYRLVHTGRLQVCLSEPAGAAAVERWLGVRF